MHFIKLFPFICIFKDTIPDPKLSQLQIHETKNVLLYKKSNFLLCLCMIQFFLWTLNWFCNNFYFVLDFTWNMSRSFEIFCICLYHEKVMRVLMHLMITFVTMMLLYIHLSGYKLIILKTNLAYELDHFIFEILKVSFDIKLRKSEYIFYSWIWNSN